MFHWAEAAIDGDTIVVRSDRVPQPAAIRYAPSNNMRPWANLFNKAQQGQVDSVAALIFPANFNS